MLKSEIEIGPVFHRLPKRIKAHASLCFIALILYRVMRQRLKAADSDLSPDPEDTAGAARNPESTNALQLSHGFRVKAGMVLERR